MILSSGAGAAGGAIAGAGACLVAGVMTAGPFLIAVRTKLAAAIIII